MNRNYITSLSAYQTAFILRISVLRLWPMVELGVLTGVPQSTNRTEGQGMIWVCMASFAACQTAFILRITSFYELAFSVYGQGSGPQYPSTPV